MVCFAPSIIIIVTCLSNSAGKEEKCRSNSAHVLCSPTETTANAVVGPIDFAATAITAFSATADQIIPMATERRFDQQSPPLVGQQSAIRVNFREFRATSVVGTKA